MQTNRIYRLVIALFLLVIVGACTDMESIHEEYLQGEKIYAGKLDSLSVMSGYKRVKILGVTDYLGNSKECIVEWDGNVEVFPIENIEDGKFEFLVEDLDERNYEFEVYSKDAEGNLSIFQIVKGKAVGDVFKGSQFARRISNFVNADGSLAVLWADKAESEYVIHTAMKYENTNGGMTEVSVYPDDSLTALSNWLAGGDMEILSTIISGDNGFDTLTLDPVFSLLPVQTVFILDKNLFSLAKMASDNPGTAYFADPDQYLFDGDGSWRNDDKYGYHSGEDMMPHHLTIDLGVMTQIRKYRADLRDPNNFAGNHPKDLELWGIADTTGANTLPATTDEFIAKGWQLLHSASIPSNIVTFVEFEVDPGPTVRFVRYRVTKSWTTSDLDPATGAAQATEITFWGENAAK